MNDKDIFSPYVILDWKDKGYDKFILYKHNVKGDGHCLVHSVLYAISPDYRKRNINGKSLSRTTIAISMRNELASKLYEINSKTGKTFYESINNGSLASSGKLEKEFSIDSIANMLRSTDFLGHESIIILEEILNITIYVLDEVSQDIYMNTEIPKNRKSVVVYYSRERSHFDMISTISNKTGKLITYFSPNSPLILFLRKRMLINKQLGFH